MVDISRSAATDAELDTELESGGRRWPALTAFTDFGFRKSTAQHVVPLLYGLVIAGAVVLYPAGAVVAGSSEAEAAKGKAAPADCSNRRRERRRADMAEPRQGGGKTEG